MRVGAGGGGIFGGPPLGCGIGCCCNGATLRGIAFGSFGSMSSHSPDKSPELNLSIDFIMIGWIIKNWTTLDQSQLECLDKHTKQ